MAKDPTPTPSRTLTLPGGGRSDGLRMRHFGGGRFVDLGPVAGGATDRVRHLWDRTQDSAAVGKLLPAGPLPVEARVLGELRHPGVVGRRHVEVLEDGQWLLVLEPAGALDLERLTAEGPLPVPRALALVAAAARAAGAAHAAGWVHRDLAPAHLRIGEGDRVVLIDWGLACPVGGAAAGPAICGTPPWLSPEQAAGRSATAGPAADVHALGALLHLALTGRPPYRGAGPAALLAAVTRGPDLDPGLADGLRDLVTRCLANDPAMRPADGAALALAVDALASDALAACT